ncbi:MAG: hypothetical protein EP330_06775 [Deltaproteobacteria bacterium]|nr:MAG: hypothetical protein EP330_06775 [Deltaproteobacteria bacterium]
MAIKKQARDWDVRVVKALSRRGELDNAAYKAHLESLPDEASEAVDTETRFSTPYADRLADESGDNA